MSVWILSSIDGAEFAIFKNGNNIAQAFITNNGDGKSNTATAVVAVEIVFVYH
jgi:homoserine dehydrogenase